MFEEVSQRLPRAPRRKLSHDALRSLDRFVDKMDRHGANSCTTICDASNDDVALIRRAA